MNQSTGIVGVIEVGNKLGVSFEQIYQVAVIKFQNILKRQFFAPPCGSVFSASKQSTLE